jgi:hypothetical protein
MPTDRDLRQIGGSRATAAASDHHTPRPAFESVDEPIE